METGRRDKDYLQLRQMDGAKMILLQLLTMIVPVLSSGELEFYNM